MSKVIFITGARKGIGRFLAEYFISQGQTVIGCSRRDSDLDHNSYHHYLVDVSNEKSVVKIVRQIVNKHGSIDVLLNNAGVAAMNAFLLTPGSTAKRVLGTNTLGTFFMMREVSKNMMKNRQGRIIIIVASPRSLPDENHAALREAVLPAQAQEPRATNDRAKGATRGGRRVVVVAGNAQQYALQDVVW